MDEGALASELVFGKTLEGLGTESTVLVDEVGTGLNQASKLVLRDVKSHLFRSGRQNHGVHHSAECLAVDIAIRTDLIVRIAQLIA